MKKYLSCILALVLLLSAFGAIATAEETPVLTIFIEACATVEDFETNLTTLWFEEKLGCDLQFIVAPTGSVEEKANVLLNSKNYPDIFYLYVPDEDLYGVETGILMDISSLITPEIMPNYSQMLEMYPEISAAMTASNGAMYSFAAYGGTALHSQYPVKMFYNTANLEKIDMEVPTTLDELHECLTAWVALDENNVGIVGCNDLTEGNPVYFITNCFTYQPYGTAGYDLGLRLNGEEVETMYDDDEYREALAYMNELYEEGLIYEGSFSQSTDQAKAILAADDEPVLFWTTTHNAKFVVAGNTPELYAHTRTLDPLVGPDGAQYTTFRLQQATACACISSTCKYPELAAKFIDLHYSAEGIGTINFGPIELGNWRYTTDEEKQYCIDNGYEVQYISRLTAFDSGVQNYKWQPQIISSDGINSNWDEPVDLSTLDFSDPANGSNYRLYSTQTQYEVYYQDELKTIPNLKFTTAENEEIDPLTISISSYIKTARADFITGTRDIETEWDSYVEGLKNLNIDLLVEYYQTAYDRSK